MACSEGSQGITVTANLVASATSPKLETQCAQLLRHELGHVKVCKLRWMKPKPPVEYCTTSSSPPRLPSTEA